MSKLSVSQAADFLGITKEAIYNRIRRNTLQSVTENGTKYVIFNEEEKTQTQNIIKPKKEEPDKNGRFVDFLLKQIDELKSKNENLEVENNRLRDEKEKCLIEAKEEIKTIYKEKDDRLKHILSLIIKPFLFGEKKKNLLIDVEAQDLSPYEREIVLKTQGNTDMKKWQDVNIYMDKKKYSEKKKLGIYKELKKKVPNSKFLKIEDGLLYIRSGKKIKELLKNETY